MSVDGWVAYKLNVQPTYGRWHMTIDPYNVIVSNTILLQAKHCSKVNVSWKLKTDITDNSLPIHCPINILS